MRKHTTVSERKIRGVPVVLTYPQEPTTITFLLTAANLALKNYDSIKETLVEMGHLVVGFYINVLSPPWKNHRIKAQNVRHVFEHLKSEFGIKEFSIIGHSIGGKIALLVAALHNDNEELVNVLALDPVDQSPVEFTKETNNLTISRNHPNVYVTCTENAQPLVNDEHNGIAIQRNNRKIKLIKHTGASHFAYCSGEPGSLSWANSLPMGKVLENKAILEETLEFIHEHFYSDLLTRSATALKQSAITNVGKKLTSGISEFGKEVTSMFSKPML